MAYDIGTLKKDTYLMKSIDSIYASIENERQNIILFRLNSGLQLLEMHIVVKLWQLY